MLVCGVLASASLGAYAVEPATRATAGRQQATENADQKILAAKTFRSSKLNGMTVRNMEGEELGSINDLVIDVSSGKVTYAAMSVGGVLGIGDKLLAVPFARLKFDHGQDEMFFVLDMPKEKINAAPGFNEDDWPDFADPHWADKIDEHYRQTEVRTGAENETVPRDPVDRDEN
jgi:sporulation protein YlmC with PRC-barrel domain